MRRRRNQKRQKWFRKNNPFNKEGRLDKIFPKNVKVGSRPYMRRYGEHKPSGKLVLKEPAPLIDVFRNGDEVVIVAEIKGFRRENIKIQIENQRLILSAWNPTGKFYKVLSLPCKVTPETMRTNYKNGVLEIRLKRTLMEKPVNKVTG